MLRRSMEAMPCPVCRTGLIMSERQGIEIDYCPDCRGVWLDRGELDKIIERSATPPVRLQERNIPDAWTRLRPPDAHDGRDRSRKKRSFLEELFD
ncbi:zf-TFIIB domain-containing protein [Sphingobium fuliginis]|uniref:TFIIB-type zinc ribbon-containing protein n=1 Tax=Sphingobium fuliginis (strain ATCC 27551) TaxID=336203 RepID=UPI0009E5FD53|nr:zf-TFIIB domain-containing protein [Sphingobium fuliginis]